MPALAEMPTTAHAPLRLSDPANPVHVERGAVVVAPMGSLTGREVDGLKDTLERVAALDPKVVVLDLGSVDYLSSAAIQEVLRLRRRLGRIGGVVRVAGPTELVRQVLHLTALDRVIPVFEDVGTAVAAA